MLPEHEWNTDGQPVDDANPVAKTVKAIVKGGITFSDVTIAQMKADEARKEEMKRREEHEELLRNAQCSICGAHVSQEFAEECLQVARQRFRDQMSFCEKHTMAGTKRKWQARGYPEIDWDKLGDRIASNFPRLEAIIMGNDSSEFEEVFDEICRGPAAKKRLRLTATNDEMLRRVSVGYYGPKGAVMM